MPRLQRRVAVRDEIPEESRMKRDPTGPLESVRWPTVRPARAARVAR